LENWDNTTRLDAAVAAVTSVVERFQDSLTVGAIFVPFAASSSTATVCSTGGVSGSFVQPIDGTGNIPFTTCAHFLEQFKAHFGFRPPLTVLGTPFTEAFDRADAPLQAALPKFHGRTAVLVITDGMPNCFPDAMATGIPTKTEPARAADWVAENVGTYVFGL